MTALGPADTLLSPQALAARLGQPDLLLIDMRMAADGGQARYAQAHVPGAIHSDYAFDGWRQRVGAVPGLLPEAPLRAALFAKLGITPARHVVLIPAGTSANDFAASARAFWTLKISGHRGVSILDGGTRGWVEAGLPVDDGIALPTPASAYPVVETAGYRSLASDIPAPSGCGVIIDARAPSYFEGREKAAEAKAAGHIPGAISRDYTLAFDTTTGRLRPATDLTAMFAPADGKPTIVYCNTGHTAALDWFVIREVLGNSAATLYDGSMTEWTQDEARPVETGASL